MNTQLSRKPTRVEQYRLPKSDPPLPADAIQGYNAYFWESIKLTWLTFLDWFDRVRDRFSRLVMR